MPHIVVLLVMLMIGVVVLRVVIMGLRLAIVLIVLFAFLHIFAPSAAQEMQGMFESSMQTIHEDGHFMDGFNQLEKR